MKIASNARRPLLNEQTWFERRIIKWVSFTWAYADQEKRWWYRRDDRYSYTVFIKSANHWYLIIALISSTIHLLATGNSVLGCDNWTTIGCHLLWSVFLLSRCNEVFYAFGKDALEKGAQQPSVSLLTGDQRIILAIKSYVELIINFALLLSFLPLDGWLGEYKPRLMSDLLFYSSTNITTSGNGAMIPVRWYTQFLTTYEIYIGLVLLVVCFALYAGLVGSDKKY